MEIESSPVLFSPLQSVRLSRRDALRGGIALAAGARTKPRSGVVLEMGPGTALREELSDRRARLQSLQEVLRNYEGFLR